MSLVAVDLCSLRVVRGMGQGLKSAKECGRRTGGLPFCRPARSR
jgi:hypothetical protein